MNGKLMMYVNQYGDIAIWARSARGLLRQCQRKGLRGHLFKIYADKKDGRTVHCGYGVGRQWFNAFVPYEGAV